MGHIFGSVPKKASSYLRSLRFLLCYLLETLWFLCFTFMAVIHFDLIFVESVMSLSHPILKNDYFD